LGNNPNEGFVHFKAFFIDQQQTLCLEEQSRFVREKKQWFYIDGTFPKHNKVGRNEPCPCGSGKKFKQCCG
jgi:SEC-C motif-containing protein